VEQITSYRTRPPGRVLYPIPKLPPYLRLAFIILSGFSVANIGVRAMGQYTLPPNPFFVFADIFPGQLGTATEGYEFSCVRDYYNPTPLEERCGYNLPTGMFSSINVIITQGVIVQTTFVLRDDTFRVGDLMAILEATELRDYGGGVAFLLYWHFIIANTAAHDGQPSLFLPVWSVSFIDKSILN
jgi:hypothetical protein